jgi:MraZ protein
MELFRGRFTNRIDAKGRVSVPAKFRSVSASQGLNGIICFPSIQGAFIEGCGPAFSTVIDEMLDRLDPFSRERDLLAAVLIGGSAELMFDSDGRVVLPEELREHARIADEATFVGLGQKFQIWEPKAYLAFHAEALEKARAHGDLLKSPFAPVPGGGGAR